MLACFVDLIRQLYSDGYITAEEASHLESKNMFKEPITATTTTPIIPSVICDHSVFNGNSSRSGVSVIGAAKTDATQLTELHPTNHVETIASTCTQSLANTLGVHVTEHNSMGTNDASVFTLEQNVNVTSHEHDLELPPCVTQSYELSADSKLSDNLKNEASDTTTLSGQDHQDKCVNATSTELAHKSVVTSTDQTDVPNVDANLSQHSTTVSHLSEESHKEVSELDLTANGHVKSSSSLPCNHKEDTINGMKFL